MKAKYIHPYTNFGFRKLFGAETNKDLLIDFLNQLLPGKHKIKAVVKTAYEEGKKGAANG